MLSGNAVGDAGTRALAAPPSLRAALRPGSTAETASTATWVPRPVSFGGGRTFVYGRDGVCPTQADQETFRLLTDRADALLDSGRWIDRRMWRGASPDMSLAAGAPVADLECISLGTLILPRSLRFVRRSDAILVMFDECRSKAPPRGRILDFLQAPPPPLVHCVQRRS